MAQYLQNATMTTLEVTPSSVLIDDVVHISASGLPASHPVTIHAAVSENGPKFDSHFESFAHYVTSCSGDVMLNRDESVGGSYEGKRTCRLYVLGVIFARRGEKLHVTPPPGQVRPGKRIH